MWGSSIYLFENSWRNGLLWQFWSRDPRPLQLYSPPDVQARKRLRRLKFWILGIIALVITTGNWRLWKPYITVCAFTFENSWIYQGETKSRQALKSVLMDSSLVSWICHQSHGFATTHDATFTCTACTLYREMTSSQRIHESMRTDLRRASYLFS